MVEQDLCHRDPSARRRTGRSGRPSLRMRETLKPKGISASRKYFSGAIVAAFPRPLAGLGDGMLRASAVDVT